MSIDTQCCICNASFKPENLNDKGKCVECEKAFPSAKNKRDAMQLTRPELHLNEEITEEVVRKIAKEEIQKYVEGVKNAAKSDKGGK